MRTILTIFFLMITMALSREKVNKIKEIEIMPLDTLKEVVIIPERYDSVIIKTLLDSGVSKELSLIILAQALHECDSFQSRIFEENWNFSGMKRPKKRLTTSVGKNRGHAVYNSVEECAQDYIYYMRCWNIPFHETSITKYCKLLKKKGYFEDDINIYINGVRSQYKKLKITNV